jgi:hypothetical protein
MKYPQEQYEVLIETLKQLSLIVDLKTTNPHTLHYIVYQQTCKEGQEHNKLYVYGKEMKRFGNLTNEEKIFFVPLIQNVNYDFQLYPEGCNDNHIETAMKKALKDLEIPK